LDHQGKSLLRQPPPLGGDQLAGQVARVEPGPEMLLLAPRAHRLSGGN
jgi:hypothetical protein